MRKVYLKIEKVIRVAGRPLLPDEFESFFIRSDSGDGVSGRQYCDNYSVATLGRRMREMVVLGRLISKPRPGKAYKEFDLATGLVPQIKAEVAA